MNQIEFSDTQILSQKCPIHKINQIVLRLDSDDDPNVMKCYRCLIDSKFKSQILIQELLQSNYSTIFKTWPFYNNDDDEYIFEELQKISEWQPNYQLEEIDKLFDDYSSKFVQKLHEMKKKVIQKIEETKKIKQDCIQFYNQISQKEKLKEIIRYQQIDNNQNENLIAFHSSKIDKYASQNEMLIQIIKENKSNYVSNYKNLSDLIKQSSKITLNIDQLQEKLDKILTKMNELDFLDSVEDEDEIQITKTSELYKCQDQKVISIDFDNIPIRAPPQIFKIGSF